MLGTSASTTVSNWQDVQVSQLTLAPAVDIGAFASARLAPNHAIIAFDAHRHALLVEFQLHFTNLPGLAQPDQLI